MTDIHQTAPVRQKRILSEELKAKMSAGRKAAAEKRRARSGMMGYEPVRLGSYKADDFEGLTATDCCDECRDGYCVITGVNHCGHPNKGGIQAAHQSNPDIKARYVRAKRHLKALAAEQKTE